MCIVLEPCPNNFTRVLEGCYYFGERKFDWQVANKYCRRMGALLVEFESTEERNAVISAIQTTVHLKGTSTLLKLKQKIKIDLYCR